MATIVAGLTTPHGPQMSTHWSKWNEFEQRDRNHPQLLIDYIPAYRNSAAMGHGLSLAYWK